MLNSLVVTVAFGVAAALIGVAWSRHKTAVTKCKARFFSNDNGTTEIDSKSQILCQVFVYISTGVMTGLWIGLAFVQFYFVLVTKFYGSAQSEEHKRYLSVYSTADDIMLENQPSRPVDAWDSRSPPRSQSPPDDHPPVLTSGQYQHVRNASNTSSIMDEPYQQPNTLGYEQYYSTPPMNKNNEHQYRDDDHHYGPPAGDPPFQHQQDSYEYSNPLSSAQQAPYEAEPDPRANRASELTIPTGLATASVDPNVPRYQLHDRKA